MFFWSDLKFVDKDGKDFDPSKSQDTNAKLNALLAGLQSTNKSTLIREFVRPLVIDAAEVIAGLMEPDPMMLNLMAGGGGGLGQLGGMGGFNGGQYFPAPSGSAPVVNVHPAPSYGSVPQQQQQQVNPIAAQYEGQLIMDEGHDPRVFHITGGQRHWVTSQEVFNRRRYNGNSIIRNVPIATIMQIPAGADEY
jgi:hypothetical protein